VGDPGIPVEQCASIMNKDYKITADITIPNVALKE